MSEQTVNVMIPRGKRPGLRACGPYRVGEPYDVDLETALHLVDVKGFDATNDDDAQRLEHFRRQQATQAERDTPAAGDDDADGDTGAERRMTEFLGRHAAQITAAGALDGVNADEAEALLELERQGKSRPTVIEALQAHRDALEADADESGDE